MNKPYLILLALLSWTSIAFGQKKVVTSSASMIWDMVANIAGDKVDNRLIVPIGGDPHLHKPIPADAQMVAESDIIFINGLTFEGWITKLVENSGTKGKTIVVTEGLNAISSSEYENSYDPHAWMDVSFAQTYISNILKGLKELDPANADFYQANYQNYSKRLEDLDAYIQKRVEEIPEEQRLLVTSHDAFAYYGRRYGIKVEGIVGISTESEARTSDMVRISQAIKDAGVPAIFVETTINPKLINQIAKDNNVEIGGALFADSIGEKGSGGNSYYDMMKSNTDKIVNALIKKKPHSHAHEAEASSGRSKLYAYLGLGAIMILGLILLILKMNK